MTRKQADAMGSALIVSHNYWPTPGAGQLRMGLLAQALQDMGYTVTVTSCGEAAVSGRLRGPAGETIVQVGVVGVPRIVNLCRLAMKAASLLLKRPSLVVTDPPPVVAAPVLGLARTLGIPSAYYLSDSWQAVAEASPRMSLRRLSRLFGILDNAAFRSATAVIAVTDSLAQRVEAAAPGKVTRRPNGIDLSAYSPDGPAWEPPPGFPKRYLVYAGNSGQVHGSHIFIDAADQLQDDFGPFGLVYVTYGSHVEECYRSARARARRTPVLFLDRMPPAEIARVLRGAVAALSSLRDVPGYHDARPIKALAGIASGIPVAHVGGGDFGTVICAEGLGFASDHSLTGAASTMREVLSLEVSQRARLRDRARRYARSELDQSRISVGIASALHELSLSQRSP